MVGAALKKLAAENLMTVESGVAYGMLKGCYVSLSEGAGYKRMCIYVGCHHRPEEERAIKEGEVPEHLQAANAIADYIIEFAGNFSEYRIMTDKHRLPGVQIAQGGSVVIVNFFDNPGTMKCIEAFVEKILPEIAPATEPNVCMVCGKANDDTVKAVMVTDEAVVPTHEACALPIAAALSAKARPGGAFLGIIGALIGAAIGAVGWLAVGIIGYITSIAGALIGWLAAKGYDLLGGKQGAVKVVTLIVCVLLAVLAGSVGTEVYGLHDYYQEATNGIVLEAGEELIPESEFIMENLPILWEDPEVAAAFFKDLGLGVLFAFMGCFRLLRQSSGKGGVKAQILKG